MHPHHELEDESEKTTVIQKIRKLKTARKRGVLAPISSLRYFGITFREPRTMQIIHPTPEAYSLIVSVIKSVWKPGIAQIKNDYNQEVCVIKLNGSPFWFSFSNEFALQVHYTILKLIDRLDKKGYQLILATDVARYFELSTLFFTEKPPRERIRIEDPFHSSPNRSQYMSVTISHTNQLQLANCSLSNKLAITQLINNTWHYGINKEISLPSGYIIVLNGAPWCNKKLAFSARSLLHQLTLLLTQRNWNLITSARIKNHRDSLIFQYEAASTFDSTALHATFLSLSLSEKDKLRVIHCSDNNLIQDLKDIIMKIWKPGLLSDYKKSGGHEFVLAEKPWWCESTEAIKTRYFICDMLELLYARGFKIHAAIECHPDLIEKTTLTFKKGPARRVKVVCISFDENDKVRVINGSQMFVNAIRSVLSNRVGTEGIQKEREFLKSVEFTLSDLNMWDGKNRRDAQVGKSICCHILHKVGELGWCVVLSADATSAVKGNNNRHDIPMDVHSWYLIQATTTSKAFHKLRKKKELRQRETEHAMGGGSDANSVASLIIAAETAELRAAGSENTNYNLNSSASPAQSQRSLKRNSVANSIASLVSEGALSTLSSNRRLSNT
ncbi:hypothetical protein ACHWQZ_G002215 [Mnemiopsis leidyi]